MKHIWKSKFVTAGFVLFYSSPGLVLFALACLWPATELYLAAAICLTCSVLYSLSCARILPNAAGQRAPTQKL